MSSADDLGSKPEKLSYAYCTVILFRLCRRTDTFEMGSHLIDLVPRLLWSHLDEVISEYKLIRRLRGSSLLAQPYRHNTTKRG